MKHPKSLVRDMIGHNRTTLTKEQSNELFKRGGTPSITPGWPYMKASESTRCPHCNKLGAISIKTPLNELQSGKTYKCKHCNFEA